MCIKAPLVSIVIPVYKVEPYICKALDSVINQSYKNLQIILVDDGSPDNCGKICDEYAQKDARITVIHKQNGGVSSARNAGMDAATGDWLYFMDPDDWIEPETVEMALASAQKTGADMIIFDFDYVKAGRHYRLKTPNNVKNTKEYYFDDLANVKTFLTFYGSSVCTSIIRFDCIRGRSRFDLNMKVCEDSVFRTECYFCLHAFTYIPKVCYHYRYTPGSASNGRIDPNQRLNDVKTRCERLKEHADRFPEKNTLLAFACSKYLDSVSTMAEQMLPLKSLSAAQKREYIRQAIHTAYYEECFRCYDKNFTTKMTRASMIFGKPTVASIYFAYCLKKLYRVFSFIK